MSFFTHELVKEVVKVNEVVCTAWERNFIPRLSTIVRVSLLLSGPMLCQLYVIDATSNATSFILFPSRFIGGLNVIVKSSGLLFPSCSRFTDLYVDCSFLHDIQ